MNLLSRVAVHAYLGSLSENSRRTMESALSEVARMIHQHREELPDRFSSAEDFESFDWTTVSDHDMADLDWSFDQNFKSTTANVMRSSMSGVFRMVSCLAPILGVELDHTPPEIVFDRTTKPVARAKISPITQDELKRLISSCDTNTASGKRDAAIISLISASGLPRGAVARMSSRQYPPNARWISVPSKRQGGEDTFIPLKPSTRRLLDAWMAVRGQGEGPLFISLKRSRTNKGKAERPAFMKDEPITDQAIYVIIQKAAKRAGLDRRITPNLLRKSMVEVD